MWNGCLALLALAVVAGSLLSGESVAVRSAARKRSRQRVQQRERRQGKWQEGNKELLVYGVLWALDLVRSLPFLFLQESLAREDPSSSSTTSSAHTTPRHIRSLSLYP